MRKEVAGRDRPVRVFVSYAQNNQEHVAQVRLLCQVLAANGIDVTLDQYESNEPQRWYQWLVDRITTAAQARALVAQRLHARSGA